MMQGQDPEVEFKDGIFNLVQSDGCNIHLRRATTLGGLVTAANPIIFAAGCSNVWAPEIHWLSNYWYLYYSVDTGASGNERVHVAQSSGTSPSGPYTVRGVLNPGYWNIDGSVFVSTNGQLYFICSGSPSGTQSIYIAPMSNPYMLSGPLTLISSPTQSWERNGTVNEGPYGFVRNGQVFIVYSASGCWTDDYCLGLLTLTGANILNSSSWTKAGPVFTKQPGAYGPGHNCVVQDATGQWWNLYHANNLTGQACGGYRQLRAQRIFWSATNVPDFGSPVPIGSLVTDEMNFLAVNFPLTESSGTSAASSGCGHAGRLVGTPVWAKPGLKLNGMTDYVDCGPEVGNDVQHTLTLAAWIRADAFIDWASVITKGTNSSPYAMQTWHDGALRFSANWGSPGGGVGSGSWNSNTKMTTNQWYHVAVTYDGANIRFYINAALDASQPAASLRFGVVSESLIIGADFPGGDEYFNGTIRDARVYGRALTAAEIGSISGFSTPPVFISAGANLSLGAGQYLRITNTATEPAAPPQTLSYSLLTGPSNAAVESASGLFSWRPKVAQAPSTNPIALVVSDNGSPNLSATQSLLVTVTNLAPARLDQVLFTSGMFRVRVNGDYGPDYVLQTTTNLQPPVVWRPIFTNPSPVPPFLFSDPISTNSESRFYQLQLGP